MFSGTLFTIFRIFEILTLIPIWGILAWFIDAYSPATAPDRILFLFIVSLLATIWAFFTLFIYHRLLWTPLYICIIDLCFFGVFIAGLVLLSPSVQNTNCVDWTGSVGTWGASVGVTADKQCMMLKSSWGLAIADTILFFLTAMLAAHIWHRTGVVVERPRRRRHRSRW
jgi:hypothetical protein